MSDTLAHGATLTTEALTHAAREAWQASGLTQMVAAERLGVNRVTFAHAIGTPDRSLHELRRRIIETFMPEVRIVGPLYLVERQQGGDSAP